MLMKPRRTTSFFFKGISVDVKAQFKAYCARRGISMRKVLEDLMRSVVKNELNFTVKKYRVNKMEEENNEKEMEETKRDQLH